MKNFSLALSGLALFFTLVFSGCSSSEPGPTTTTPATKTLKEKITGAKWKVKTAYEEYSPVYELGSATNKSPNYSKFILDFTNPVTGKLTEVDDSQYSFTLSVDELKSTLSLSAITPAISGGDYS
nr:hypothetical protein [Pseudarcicella sp.]